MIKAASVARVNSRAARSMSSYAVDYDSYFTAVSKRRQ